MIRRKNARNVARQARRLSRVESLEVRTLLAVTPADIAQALAHSPEHFAHVVTQAYQDYLGRTPDAQGLQYWVERIQDGLSKELLEASFIGSQEYIDGHGGAGQGWVDGMYQDLLGRSADAGGRDYWIQRLAQGTTESEVAYGFAASDEREGQTVEEDYQNYLGRSASDAEVEYWVNEFRHGRSNDDIVGGFVGSPEYFQQNGGQIDDFLDASYQDVFGRAPDDEGRAFWRAALDVEYEASLSGSTAAVGHAEYEVEQEPGHPQETQFEVQVEGADANTTYDVLVNGQVVGQLTTNATGHGQLKYTSSPNDPGELPLPSGFPTIEHGTTVAVGTLLSGAFAVGADDDVGDEHAADDVPGHDDSENANDDSQGGDDSSPDNSLPDDQLPDDHSPDDDSDDSGGPDDSTDDPLEHGGLPVGVHDDSDEDD